MKKPHNLIFEDEWTFKAANSTVTTTITVALVKALLETHRVTRLIRELEFDRPFGQIVDDELNNVFVVILDSGVKGKFEGVTISLARINGKLRKMP